jgi:hypothetical protein
MSNAGLITPINVTANGMYGNSLSLLTDTVITPEGNNWKSLTNVFWNIAGKGNSFVFDLGDLYSIQDMLLSVDNNDKYSVYWSVDANSWNNLFTIEIAHGEVRGGMDTMSTDSTHGEYVSGIDFNSVNARYINFLANDGDDKYSLSEIMFYGSRVQTSTVPEPATVFIIFLGIMMLYFSNQK